MKSRPHKNDHTLSRFEEWLNTAKVQPKADLLARVRERLHDESGTDLDATIDQLLKPDPTLHNPYMAARIRHRLKEAEAPVHRNPWFQWASPLAAAAVLGFAFFAFQSKAPTPEISPALQQFSVATNGQGIQHDSELTQIFALASNLEATTDLSRLQSVDNWAFLLE